MQRKPTTLVLTDLSSPLKTHERAQKGARDVWLAASWRLALPEIKQSMLTVGKSERQFHLPFAS
jgi:hypothetical protein